MHFMKVKMIKIVWYEVDFHYAMKGQFLDHVKLIIIIVRWKQAINMIWCSSTNDWILLEYNITTYKNLFVI